MITEELSLNLEGSGAFDVSLDAFSSSATPPRPADGCACLTFLLCPQRQTSGMLLRVFGMSWQPFCTTATAVVVVVARIQLVKLAKVARGSAVRQAVDE